MTQIGELATGGGSRTGHISHASGLSGEIFGHIKSVKIHVIPNPTGWLHVDIFQF